MGDGQWLVHNSEPCDHIVLGLNTDRKLDDIAAGLGGRSFMSYGDGFHVPFLEAIRNPNIKITLNTFGLEGFDLEDAVYIATQKVKEYMEIQGIPTNKIPPPNGGAAYSFTDWELYMLSKTGRLDSVTLVHIDPRTVPRSPKK